VDRPDSSSAARLGLAFLGAPAIPEMVELARRAEEAGFESIWVAETRITRDAVVPLAAIAAATKRIRLGTAIMNVFTRGPVVIGITFLGLDELAPGRIVMGLGTGSPRILAPQGQPFEKALTRLREYCEVLRPLLRGEEVTYDGTAIRLEGARVEDILGGGKIASAARTIPLYLGVTGPRSLELAGSVADGVLLNVCLSTSYVEHARRLIGRGAASVGRSAADVELGMMTVVSPDADSGQAKDRARRFVAVYLSMFPNIARETGLPGDFLDSLGASLERGGVEEAAVLVDDEIVDTLVVAGTPEECRRRLGEYRAAGVELQVLIPLEGAFDATIETFGAAA
jgi:5,10-methylenetetrahydromethanopterin reductase